MTELRSQDNVDQTANLLVHTIRNLSEALTGIAASDKKEWYLSIGYILQRIRSGRFIETLLSEWNKYREKGRIKADYLDTEQHQECLQQLLDFLDRDSPDHIRFAAMKQIFLNAATEQLDTRESILPQQYMSICRKLNSGEVIVLQATYRITEAGEKIKGPTAIEWLQIIAQRSPLKHTEHVELHERTLIEKNLISPRTYRDKSGVQLTKYNRLTGLGYDLCRFMQEHDVNTHV